MVPVIQSFKNESGVWITKGLFYEVAIHLGNVMFTLKEEDHKGYKSLKRLYMEADDLTEYTFAVTHLGGWAHWQSILECKWFHPYIEAWRHELEVRTRARALSNILKEASSNEGKNAFTANKLLLDRGWVTEKQKNKRGAPTKDEVKKAAVELARASGDLDDDFGRIIHMSFAND